MSSRGLASDRRPVLGQNPGPERPAGVTAAAVLARQAGLRTSGWSPDRFWRSTALTPAAG